MGLWVGAEGRRPALTGCVWHFTSSLIISAMHLSDKLSAVRSQQNPFKGWFTRSDFWIWFLFKFRSYWHESTFLWAETMPEKNRIRKSDRVRPPNWIFLLLNECCFHLPFSLMSAHYTKLIGDPVVMFHLQSKIHQACPCKFKFSIWVWKFHSKTSFENLNFQIKIPISIPKGNLVKFLKFQSRPVFQKEPPMTCFVSH